MFSRDKRIVNKKNIYRLESRQARKLYGLVDRKYLFIHLLRKVKQGKQKEKAGVKLELSYQKMNDRYCLARDFEKSS